MSEGLNFSRRLRRTPYTSRVEAAGVRGFSVVNHMLLPKAYQATVEEDYWHLREHVQIWDVSCQRQVQICGTDAHRLVQWMTPRNLSDVQTGQCRYVPIVDEDGGLINDPVLLKLSDDCYWLSVADSDVLLFAKGLCIGAGLQAQVTEPDVSPLAVQGPKSEQLMVDVFGEDIRRIGFFRFSWFDFKGTSQLIARSGYSRQGGFEIYLNDASLGPDLWDAIFEAGTTYNLRPGCPNLPERIEGGLLSYGNEMTRANNPFEMGLGRFCALEDDVEFIGRAALERIRQAGIQREIRGVKFGSSPCPVCAEPWPVEFNGKTIGTVTSATWSPRLGCNVGLALMDRGYWDERQAINVSVTSGAVIPGSVCHIPFS